MMIRRVAIAAAVLFAFAGCRKEPLPQAVETTPVFYLKATSGGNSLLMEAGNLGYRMNPGFSQDSNGVYVLSGELSSSCTDCYDLRILINDHMTSAAGAPVHIDSALRLGHYLYNDKSLESTVYSVVLTPVKDFDPTGQYRWTISQANYPDQVFTDYEITHRFDARQNYTVSLLYEDANGCQTTHHNVFHLGNGLQPQITATSMSQTDVRYSFTPVLTGSGTAVSYHWQFGDGAESNDMAPEHPYVTIGGSYYTVTLTVTDQQQYKTVSTYQIPGTTDPLCLANFRATITAIPNMKAYSKVTVELIDASGKVFTTRGFVQPASSLFEVVHIEHYKADADNRPTKKYKALFNCILRNGSEEMPLTDAEAVMAVSYK